jgi:hypothetical protein
MRSVTVLWASELGAPVRISHLKSRWQPGEDVAELLYAAMRADPDLRVGRPESDGLSVFCAGVAHLLAVFEGWVQPLHLNEGEAID